MSQAQLKTQPANITMYDVAIPNIIRALTNLSAILTKGASFAEAKKIDPSILINARLAPDMFPLSRQVQIACDIAKGGAGRLSSLEIPSFADSEATFDELKARIEKTIKFLKTTTPAQFIGSEEKPISLKAGPNELSFNGQDYLLNFVLPNVYFHATTTYAILRHNGVEVGKMDFLGA